MLAGCPIETTLSLLSGKWKILILKELIKGPVRYTALNKNITGISSKVLTQQLREMEEDGLILRKIFAEVPPRVEYGLSEMGTSMLTILQEMRKWGLTKNTQQPIKCHQCRQCE
ncbi:helix-turn-helix domain-containing protein [Azotosporobacter soli]|uniref:winged helix-turn-helix transcriptional regulator n=1 Tax=Azotosporobacter soli TaxID=3055040 RepID=UPI0031FE91F0